MRPCNPYTLTWREDAAGSSPVVAEDILVMGIASPGLLRQLPDAFLMVVVVLVRPGEPDLLLRVLDAQVLVGLGHLLHWSQPRTEKG